MSKTASVTIGLAAIAIGLGVPAVSLYASLFYGFNYVAAGIVAIVAVLTGGGVAAVGVVQAELPQPAVMANKVVTQVHDMVSPGSPYKCAIVPEPIRGLPRAAPIHNPVRK